MLEQELLRVQHGPADVFQSLAAIAQHGDVGPRGGELIVQRRPAKGGEIEVADDRFVGRGCFAAIESPREPAAGIAQLRCQQRSVDQLQGLRELGIIAALTLARRLALRLAEDLEEMVAEIGAGQLAGARVSGQ